ncbi:MAG TPA: hypothetical protein VF372_03505, partial [Thermodesulfobacteriota bacterium]
RRRVFFPGKSLAAAIDPNHGFLIKPRRKTLLGPHSKKDIPGGVLCNVNVVMGSWSMNGSTAPEILSGVGGVSSVEIFLIR